MADEDLSAEEIVAAHNNRVRLRREVETARPWRNDALEKAAQIAERYGCQDAANDIRAMIP